MWQVYAMLVELRMGEVAGFDLSVMDAYRWHPHTERIDLDRCRSRDGCLAHASAALLQHWMCYRYDWHVFMQ